MPYFCYCKDNPGSARLRKEHLPAHLRYVESIIDRILVAGPLIDTGSQGHNGSFFLYQVDTEEEARELLHNDPYYNAGVFTEVKCQPFLPVAGTWVGGITW